MADILLLLASRADMQYSAIARPIDYAGEDRGQNQMASDQRLVFISYSRVDSDFAYRLRADLEASGFATWIDTAKLNDQGGQEWLRLIQDAVDACQAMVVIVSPESVQSRYVHMEYFRAQKHSKLVIPIHYRTVTSAPIDLELDQWIDFRGDQGIKEPYQIGLTNLTRSLMQAPTPPSYPDLPHAPKATPLTIAEGAEIGVFRPVPEPPPPPPKELTTLMTASFDARGRGDLPGEQYFITQIISQDPSFRNGRFVQRYEEVTQQIEQQRVQGLLAIARGAMVEKQWRSAIGAWQALLEIHEDDGEALAGIHDARIARAEQAERDGEFDEAVGLWQALLKLDPQDAHALEGLRAVLRTRADEAYDHGDWLRAAESWETLRSLPPEDPEARMYLDAIGENQQNEYLYESAQRSFAAGSTEGARVALDELYSDGAAPCYGDPLGIAGQCGVSERSSWRQAFVERARAAKERVETQQAEAEQQRIMAMRPKVALTLHKGPNSIMKRGWLGKQKPVIVGEPRVSVPRSSLLVNEPFAASVTFTPTPDATIGKLVIAIVRRETTFHTYYTTEVRTEQRLTHRPLRFPYDRDALVKKSTPRRYTFPYATEWGTEWRLEPHQVEFKVPHLATDTRERVFSRVRFGSESSPTSDEVAHDIELRIPSDAMYTLTYGSHQIQWLIRLELNLGATDTLRFDYSIKVDEGIYR